MIALDIGVRNSKQLFRKGNQSRAVSADHHYATIAFGLDRILNAKFYSCICSNRINGQSVIVPFQVRDDF